MRESFVISASVNPRVNLARRKKGKINPDTPIRPSVKATRRLLSLYEKFGKKNKILEIFVPPGVPESQKKPGVIEA